MNRLILRTLVCAALVLGPAASADAFDWLAWFREWRERRQETRRAVPEFDPAAVGVAAAVLAGGGVLLARRRKR